MYNNFKTYMFQVDYEDENGKPRKRYYSFLLSQDSNIAFASGVCAIINVLPLGSSINNVSMEKLD